MSLPCNFHDEADLHAGVLVGTAETVDNIELLAAELLLGELLADIPGLFGSLVVVVRILRSGPPDFARSALFGGLVVNDEFVFR